MNAGTASAPRGSLQRAQAHWLTRDTLAWSVAAPPGSRFTLHHAPLGGLQLTPQGVRHGRSRPLIHAAAGLPAELRARFPHLAGHGAFKLAAPQLAEVPELLRGQVAVSAHDPQGRLLDASAVQLPGVLDELYANDAPLGVSWEKGVPTLRVWAPTAHSVHLHLFADSHPASPARRLPMTRDDALGTWSLVGEPGWKGRYYLYEVRVFVRATAAVETNLVTDPYSHSLARNSRRSQIVDLDDPALKPAGWDTLVKPPLAAPEDIVLYELHVRDFSAHDESVPAALRGTFAAFTLAGSRGMTHLRRLAEAGLSHVHLLPAFDFSSVDDDRSTWEHPGELAAHGPASPAQQAAVSAVRGRDGYNWGYDPWHYSVPEGSYASEADGPARIREFRALVQALGQAGLRVVLDVVYNHTSASGQDPRAVLDRVVPGYYHRLNADGEVEHSTCCENTASEHAMMEKLLIDSALTWARAYKVDGFRFDLMGHHLKRNLVKLRRALDALRPEADGVDGRALYVYGEGWDFGELAHNARGENAAQLNLAGTGIGSFNDRLRDAARGGGPFAPPREQGFLTGLHDDPNDAPQGTPAEQLERLLAHSDRIRVGLAGNLASYVLEDRLGRQVTGAQVDYHGRPTGYTADPQEAIHYVEAHDNETLFDAVQVKAAAGTPLTERLRMLQLGQALVAFAQGVPFFHAGQELLRSKSGDRNSYDSGDWFNRLDFSYATHNWGVGLPPAAENQAHWPLYAPLLADPALRPTSGQIQQAAETFRETLRLRASLPLLRLRSAAEIQARLRFHNTGPAQMPGVIVMTLVDADGRVDRRVEELAVVFNANRDACLLAVPALAGRPFSLHPIQASSVDPVLRRARFEPASGRFNVPGRSAALFWIQRPPVEQLALLAADVSALATTGALAPGQAAALQAKLAAARRRLAAGRPWQAAPQLAAFRQQVQRLWQRRALSEAQAEPLLREAQALLERLT